MTFEDWKEIARQSKNSNETAAEDGYEVVPRQRNCFDWDHNSRLIRNGSRRFQCRTRLSFLVNGGLRCNAHQGSGPWQKRGLVYAHGLVGTVLRYSGKSVSRHRKAGRH